MLIQLRPATVVYQATTKLKELPRQQIQASDSNMPQWSFSGESH